MEIFFLFSFTIYRSQYPDFDYIKNLQTAKANSENDKISFINKEWSNDASDWDIDDDDNYDNNNNNQCFEKYKNGNHNYIKKKELEIKKKIIK